MSLLDLLGLDKNIAEKVQTVVEGFLTALQEHTDALNRNTEALNRDRAKDNPVNPA